MPTTSYSRSPYHNKLPRTIITTTQSIQERWYLPLFRSLPLLPQPQKGTEREIQPLLLTQRHASLHHLHPLITPITNRCDNHKRLRRCPMAMRDTRRATDTYLVLEGRRGSSNTASGRENLAIGQYALPRHLNLRGMAFSSPLLCSTAPYLSQ